MKAFLKNYQQSPRKVRLVTDLIKRKPVDHALAELAFLPKRASAPIAKLLRSAVANARTKGIETETLYVKDIRVDGGVVLRRSQPASRGRAHPIMKRSSHVTVELAARPLKKAKSVRAPKS